ncbi:MAG TPA: GNAT family N-acetyltransferase [Crocinitomicaceae bacterium]|nr:GNAT family N-acetyltransferase [Crocinitomicaceae bacterium]
MTIDQYGITLKRLTLDDIELVRTWRNTPEIRKTMNFQEHITPEMQLNWFHSINNPLNYYFLIIYNNKAIGVINAKNISLEHGTAEGGIFVWEQQLENDLIPVYASLTLMNAAFKKLSFFKKFIIQVRKDNPKALTYNAILGYTINEQLSSETSYLLELSKEDFLEHTEKLNNVAQKLTEDYALPRMNGIYDSQIHLSDFQTIFNP